MDAPDATDVAIVGGGPAGCSAAITLAGQGVRVVLLEARTFPHDKLCGEFLSPECTGLLGALGMLPALRALNPVPITTACLTAPGVAWETALPGTAWGLTRRALDAALAQRAAGLGAALRTGTTVTSVRGGLAEGFTLDTLAGGRRGTLRARVVIGAHGKRSPLDRALGRRFVRRPQPFFALKAHFNGPPLPNRIELHAFPGGYCGMSEIEGGGANFCLLAHQDALRAAGARGPERVPAFLKWMEAQNPRLADWLGRAKRQPAEWLSIGQVAFEGKGPTECGLLLAGDAAGLIVPLAGDGIAMALRAGQLAAQHSAAFLSGAGAPAAVVRSYAGAWRREFAPRLRLARFLQLFLLRPRLLAAGLRLLAAAPAVGRYLVRETRGI